MAAKKATQKNNPAPSDGADDASHVDDDFFDGLEEGGTPDIDGWWSAESMKPIKGNAVGVINVTNDDGKDRLVVLVRLTHPTVGSVNGEKNQTLEVGQVAGVGITAKLTELLYFVEKQGLVAIMPLEKIKLKKGGKTMWKYKTAFESSKRSKEPARPLAKLSSKGEGEADIPF